MHVQNSNSKISSHPNLAMHLIHILLPTTFKMYCVKKGILNFSYDLEDGLFKKYFFITPEKVKIENYL